MAELLLPPAENPTDLTSGRALESPSPPADSAPTENPPVESNTPCSFFLEGRCRFGVRCHNLHPGDPGNTRNLEDHRPTNQDLSSHQPSGKKPAMKTSEDVISRLLWDTQVPAERFSIGYLDRFLGILEEPFTAFSWEDLASVGPGVLAIPKHRIQYFKYRDRVVWDKASRTDDVFGSTGSGTTILQVIEEEEVALKDFQEKADVHASDGEGVEAMGRPGDVANLDSARDAEEDSDRATGGPEAIKQLGEAMGNLNCAEQAVLAGSVETSGSGRKVVESAVARHSAEEAESSKPVLGVKQEEEPVIGEDEEIEASGSSDGRRFPCRKQRPTHFVAIQVTNPETREAVGHVQKALCKVRPDLAEFCVPLATLHLTLCLLRLDTPEEICRAVEALQELQANSRRLLPPALLLGFQGVASFHSRVLYICPTSVAELGTLARVLEEAFRRKDLMVIHPPSKDKFHLTVVKIPLRKLRPQLPADSSWLSPIEYLGTQALEALCLCETGQGRRADGFYTTVLKLDMH